MILTFETQYFFTVVDVCNLLLQLVVSYCMHTLTWVHHSMHSSKVKLHSSNYVLLGIAIYYTGIKRSENLCNILKLLFHRGIFFCVLTISCPMKWKRTTLLDMNQKLWSRNGFDAIHSINLTTQANESKHSSHTYKPVSCNCWGGGGVDPQP